MSLKLSPSLIHEDQQMQKIYRPVNRCIYCGNVADVLTDEHVIPEGIAGSWILPKASCEACQKTVGHAEFQVQRVCMGEIREKLGLGKRRSARKAADRPARFLTLAHPIKPDVVVRSISATSAPGMLHLPLFSMPGIIEGRAPSPDAALPINTIPVLTSKNGLQEFAAALDGHIGAYGKHDPIPWAKMLAKIGHSYAIAELGYEAFAKLYLPDVILGILPDRLDYFVGSPPGQARPIFDSIDYSPNILHRLSVVRVGIVEEREARRVLLAVDVTLFANFGGIRYLVVVGELTAS